MTLTVSTLPSDRALIAKMLKSNKGAVRLCRNFWSARWRPDAKINLADALVGTGVLRPFLVNWVDVVRYFIRSVEADIAADGTAETVCAWVGTISGV